MGIGNIFGSTTGNSSVIISQVAHNNNLQNQDASIIGQDASNGQGYYASNGQGYYNGQTIATTANINYQYPVNNKSLTDNTILGQMTKNNINKDEFEQVKNMVYSLMMETYLNGNQKYSYNDLAFNICEERLAKWKFKSDLNNILDEKE